MTKCHLKHQIDIPLQLKRRCGGFIEGSRAEPVPSVEDFFEMESEEVEERKKDDLGYDDALQ